MSDNAAALRAIAEDPDLLKAAHRRIEAALIDFRDNRISVPDRGNGLVVREANGEPSSTIRMTVPEALRTALRAIADELEAGGSNP
ncbi:hypothetical protein [Nocardia otitidiscaviarum]|uniref:hypothetical protein n=1 Tax=Nocardia otitidiscaviarum TaxID=1823 RepID=UPI0011DCFE8E|nr:hypothetical protein [Nocardia otitidiscaviarum]